MGVSIADSTCVLCSSTVTSSSSSWVSYIRLTPTEASAANSAQVGVYTDKATSHYCSRAWWKDYGRHRTAASTLNECKAQCDSNPQCTGVAVGATSTYMGICVPCTHASTSFSTNFDIYTKVNRKTPEGKYTGQVAGQYCAGAWSYDYNHYRIATATFAECQAQCDENAACQAVTFGVGTTNFGTCVLCRSSATGSSGNWDTYVKLVGNASSGVPHRRYTAAITSQYCSGRWAFDYHTRTAGSTADECKAQCDANSSCVAASLGVHSGRVGVCVLCTSTATRYSSHWETYITLADKKPAAGVYTKKVIASYCSGRWKLDYGRFRTGASTVEECMEQCDNNDSCQAVSMGVSSTKGVGQCVLCRSSATGRSVNWETYAKVTHTTPTAKYTGKIEAQYCSGVWTDDHKHRTAASSAAECKAQCDGNTSCKGVTFGIASSTTGRCVLCTSRSTGYSPNWETYIKLTTTESSGPTNSYSGEVESSYCSGDWSVNYHHDRTGASTNAECQAICDSTASCKAVTIGVTNTNKAICVPCASAQTARSVNWKTFVKLTQAEATGPRYSYIPHASTYCNEFWSGDYHNRTSASTIEECQAQCDSDAWCKAVTIGTKSSYVGVCVKCKSSTTRGSENWDTYVKGAPMR
jgi:hypothetical protein